MSAIVIGIYTKLKTYEQKHVLHFKKKELHPSRWETDNNISNISSKLRE